MFNEYIPLLEKEGWRVFQDGREKKVEVYGEVFPIVHPVSIHLKLYRLSLNPDVKYIHLKAANDYLWPDLDVTWNYWTERRFRTHCDDWKSVVYAGGASSAKSFDAARIALLFWLANPKQRAVLVMSTTLESLNSRIYGYCTRLLQKMKIEFPVKIRGGNNPFIEVTGKKDFLHAIKAVAAKQGDDENKISSLIGRHPEEAMMIIMDEATDLPTGLLGALPNLKTCPWFQVMAIGNSNSKFDLHGSLATPKDGWDSIDPKTVNKWETTQEKGVCLFFSCYDSPAIFETDPVKKAALSKFLITSERIEKEKKLYGEDNEHFWRMVIGFWRSEIHDATVVSESFLKNFHLKSTAEWGGYQPLRMVAGLDPAFSTGGDQCILRLAILGQDVTGKLLLDFRSDRLLFKIIINPMDARSAEIQIADQVIDILKKHRIDMGDLVVDSNGQGRALAELIWLRSKELKHPIKIYSVRQGNKVVNSFDVVIKTNYDLWTDIRRFIETDQIRGLDQITVSQFYSRLLKTKAGKQILETKSEFKSRMAAISPSLAHSPDEADAAALCLQSAIMNYGFSPGQGRALPIEDAFAFEKQHAYIMEAKLEEEPHVVPAGVAPTLDGFTCGLEDAISMKEMI